MVEIILGAELEDASVNFLEFGCVMRIYTYSHDVLFRMGFISTASVSCRLGLIMNMPYSDLGSGMEEILLDTKTLLTLWLLYTFILYSMIHTPRLFKTKFTNTTGKLTK
jgi:hypothetical protein